MYITRVILKCTRYLYITLNLPSAVQDNGSFLCTENICISYVYKDFEKIEAA